LSEAYLTHTDYQKAVEKLLIYYGFSTWHEFWIPIDGEMGRLDVYGSCARSDLCDKTTVAVEISRSSRLEKDINRVYKSRATYGFVLAIKLIEIPPVAGRNIFVVRSLSEFENKLREVLKISEDYPRITPRIIEEVPIPKYNNLDEAFERFNIPVNLRERARKLLLHAYTTCYDLYVDNENWDPSMPAERKYFVVGDKEAFNILHQLDVVDLVRDSPARTYKVYVKDIQIAKIEAERYIDQVEKELEKVINRYGWEVALITVVVQGREWLGIGDEPLFIEPPNEWSSYFAEQKELLNRAIVALGALRPVLKDRYQKFWEDLKRLGLAFSCRGTLSLLPEAAWIMLKFIQDKIAEFIKNEGLIRDLASLNMLYNYFPLYIDQDKISRFLETLSRLGLRLDDLEKASHDLYVKGITSRFTKDHPPYIIIYDEKRFKESIIEKIRLLYSQSRQKNN